MRNSTRVTVLLVSVVTAAAMVVVSVLRMLVPEMSAPLPPSVVARLGGGVEQAIAVSGALAVLVVGLAALAASRRAAGAPTALKVAALLAGALFAITTPGGVIPAAGYTFALCVVAGVVVFIVLTLLRRPWLGGLLALAAAAIIAYAVMAHDAAPLVLRILGSLGSIAPLAGMASGHVLAAAGLLAWAVTDVGGAPGRTAQFVLRHRTAITVIAAACALPYVLARASWLTPWPLFGGSAESFTADPSVQVTGLLLGSGMLMGGLLTLGLVLPWGERFPRFLAGVGGRAVPVALAVLPASIVCVLFTAGGVEFLFEGVGPRQESAFLPLMFPFWLWGPLLGLAAWGYALHRHHVPAPVELPARSAV